MSQQLSPDTNLAVAGQQAGKPRPIKSSDLDGSAVLREGQKTVIFDKQVPADKLAWFGYGHEDLPMGVKHMFADLYHADQDADGNPEPVEADILVRITDSSGTTTHADTELGDVGTLADAASEERTERPDMPAMGPHAKGHRRLQVVAIADAASDGLSIKTDVSSCRFWYTQTR
jgi:hypothetical protein